MGRRKPLGVFPHTPLPCLTFRVCCPPPSGAAWAPLEIGGDVAQGLTAVPTQWAKSWVGDGQRQPFSHYLPCTGPPSGLSTAWNTANACHTGVSWREARCFGKALPFQCTQHGRDG